MVSEGLKGFPLWTSSTGALLNDGKKVGTDLGDQFHRSKHTCTFPMGTCNRASQPCPGKGGAHSQLHVVLKRHWLCFSGQQQWLLLDSLNQLARLSPSPFLLGLVLLFLRFFSESTQSTKTQKILFPNGILGRDEKSRTSRDLNPWN